ncbi:MAG: M56 family metallopeptidase [Planctomycetes bacterium]|nr:M56 family metallopeptidase [Planctomycetota bacterium]
MSVVEFFSQPLWHRLSLTLVHFLWQGLAAAVLACAAVRILRLKRGNPRHAAYLVAFAAMAVAPLVTFVALGDSTAPVPLALQPALQIESAMPIPPAALPQAPGQLNENTLPIGASYGAPLRQRVDNALQVSLPWALVGWMNGVLILSVRLLLGFLGSRRWRCDLEPLTDDLNARVARLSDRLGLRGFSRVFVSRWAREVVALGYLRPLVLLPAALLMQMPPEMLEAVIAHELAHIRRLDLWVNLAQRVVETLLFYHPAVWWLSARLRGERELCCDELAVQTTGERLVYASALEQAGRIRLAVGQPALALGFGQDRTSTLGRVRYVLGLPPTPADSRYWLAGIIAFMVLGIIMMYVPSSLTAQVQTGETAMDLNELMTRYQAACDGAPSRYLMVIKNERDLYITYRDGDRLFRAKYDFAGPVHVGRRIDLQAMAQERTRAGDTIASMLAWASTQTPQNADVHDGVRGRSLWSDGYGHLRSGYAAKPGTGQLDYLSLPTLQRYGWPDLGPARATRRLVPDDTYALDRGLICIEEQHQVTNSRRGKITEATRFYLNPARDYICQRRHESLLDHDYAEEVTKYGQTADGRWYPLQIDEFGYRHSVQPLTAAPTAVNIVLLDTNPTFPEDVFKPEALLTRYAAQIVSDQATRPPARDAEPNASQVRVAGRVLAGETQQPIAGATVRVAVPAADMRYARVPSKQITQEDGTRSDLYETKTDANGQFELLIPWAGTADAFSVDAMAPGYGTAAGTFHSGGDNLHLVRLSFDGPLAGTASNLTILLPRSAYIAGTVRDSTGVPAAGVQVFGQMRSKSSSYGIARTQTDAQGRFEMFDFPLQKGSDEKALLMFRSPTAVPVTLSDFYELSAKKQASLEVTLPRGFKLTGVLLDASGQPAPGVPVELVVGGPIKETTTDPNGRFEMAGLQPGLYHLRAHAMDIRQKVVQVFANLPGSDQKVTLKMSHVEIKGPLRPITLFGMQLVDVTPELRQVYDLGDRGAVMVLDPGANHRRLNIGELRKGYCFWQIGDKSITSLKEMIAELLRQLAPSWTGQESQIARPPRRIRVVYTTPRSANTQYLVLTENDVTELKRVAAQLGIAPTGSNK